VLALRACSALLTSLPFVPSRGCLRLVLSWLLPCPFSTAPRFWLRRQTATQSSAADARIRTEDDVQARSISSLMMAFFWFSIRG